MKYFVHADTFTVYEVPPKYSKHLYNIVTSSDDDEINESIEFIIQHCKIVLHVDAISRSL